MMRNIFVQQYAVNSVGISNKELGSQKRGAEGDEIETPKASRGRRMGRRYPPPQPTKGLRQRRKLPQRCPKTGFGACLALKTHVLTRKFSIFDIFCDTLKLP